MLQFKRYPKVAKIPYQTPNRAEVRILKSNLPLTDCYAEDFAQECCNAILDVATPVAMCALYEVWKKVATPVAMYGVC